MAYIYEDMDGVEPISDTFGEQATNQTLYNVINAQGGSCALTYSASDMTVDLAAGSILHNGSIVTIAAASAAFTLVAGSLGPRWTWLALSSAGAAVVISGDEGILARPVVPELGDRVALALVYVPTGLTVANDATYKLDKRVPGPFPVVTKYKSSTQVFTTDTAFADVTAASGTFSFTCGASEVWMAEYYIPVSFGGTGGVKFQLTGPSAPTSVNITGLYGNVGGGAATEGVEEPFTAVTAFSSNIAAADSAAIISAGVYNNTVPCLVIIRAVIINGTTSGTVTLQSAQNSSNSTTTLGLGTTMIARRLA